MRFPLQLIKFASFSFLAFFSTYFGFQYAMAAWSETWNLTPGRLLTNSSLHTCNGGPSAQGWATRGTMPNCQDRDFFEYSYTVDHTEYSGHTKCFGYCTGKWLQPGSAVTVHFNPTFHSISVLQAGIDHAGLMVFILWAPFVFGAILLYLVCSRSLRKTARHIA